MNEVKLMNDPREPPTPKVYCECSNTDCYKVVDISMEDYLQTIKKYGYSVSVESLYCQPGVNEEIIFQNDKYRIVRVTYPRLGTSPKSTEESK